ncbi:hypothetical protein ACG873_07210 [Mesorhizobium sp. AaZ16]|uniref:hypothetical protein n=1 Tax=Mesorhizobium sp. AaZ16 TaxID=3402289 RepID=UPI00374F03CD
MTITTAGSLPAATLCAANDNRPAWPANPGKPSTPETADFWLNWSPRKPERLTPVVRKPRAPREAANDNAKYPRRYTDGGVWSPPPRLPVNDNPEPVATLPTSLPVKAADFPDMHSYRAWSDTIRRKAKPVLSWPTIERLERLESPNSAKLLATWAELSQPPRPVAENDNDPEHAIIEEDKREDIRPSIGEIAAAIGWTKVGRERSEPAGRFVSLYERPDGRLAGKEHGKVARETHSAVAPEGKRNGGFALGDLRFNPAGHLVEFGMTKSGKVLRPVEQKRAAKGEDKQPKGRTDAQIWSYLALRGEWPDEPKYVMPGEAPTFKRRPDAAKAHKMLQRRYAECGVNLDCVVDFSEARRLAGIPHGERCPTVLKTGWEFVGGVSRMIGTAKGGTSEPDFGAHRSAVELARCADFECLRKAIGEHAEVLDMACTDATAKQIGLSRGYRDSYAEKGGIAAINKALKVFSEIFGSNVR